MLHRVTWLAAATLAVVAIGTSVGYWGYGQKQQKESFARMAETQYESAFHNLVSDVRGMRAEMAKSLVTRDNTVFHEHLSDVSRLCYAAESSLSRLPADTTPSNHLQTYLHAVDGAVNDWIHHDTGATDRTVRQKLSTFYKESATVVSQLGDLQTQLGGAQGASWIRRNNNTTTGLALDGMRKVDTQVATLSAVKPTPPVDTGTTVSYAKEPIVTSASALRQVTRITGAKDTKGWQAKLYRQNQPTGYYRITGTFKGANVWAEVSQHGGHLLMYHNDRTVQTSKYDYAQAANDAARWLAAQGFTHVERQEGLQYDHTAMFTFAPTVGGVPVFGQPIQVHVALDNGSVTGFNAAKAYENPVTSVPDRKLTVNQLQKRLSPDFEVRMERQVIALNEHHQYVPAVAFYGTMKQETFCVVLDARDGTEVLVDQLT
ncbi:PepSY1/2 domain-containing protein [Alicyclobacillus dauci]|uniref:Germination protein YpeB n=1 Tax=Alicyclobacillus dauci TaxID=1475485 RepID=A0ABY6YX65_9BACL|nr:PepSY1/2 domain-containing protein [Alicyclobacillus dauci]WAH35086.1 germination protein YpeB [Alicyclobacillus dauci]